jgi:hypothetical protein
VSWADGPGLMECGRAVAICGEVFGDCGEAGAGASAASDEVGFAGILVEELAGVANDPLKVSASGPGECIVPVEARDVVLGAKLIGESQEGLLVRRRRLCEGAWGCDREDCQGEQEEQDCPCFCHDLHACSEMRLGRSDGFGGGRRWFVRWFR